MAIYFKIVGDKYCSAKKPVNQSQTLDPVKVHSGTRNSFLFRSMVKNKLLNLAVGTSELIFRAKPIYLVISADAHEKLY
jgi:hypothetical protein